MTTTALAEGTSSGAPLPPRVRLRSGTPLAGTAPGAVSGTDGNKRSGGNSVVIRDADSNASIGRSKRAIDPEDEKGARAAKRTRSWSEASGCGGDRDFDGGCDGSSTGRGGGGGSEDRCVADSRLFGGSFKRIFDVAEVGELPRKRQRSLSGGNRQGGVGFVDSGGTGVYSGGGIGGNGGIGGDFEGGSDCVTGGCGGDSGGGIVGHFEGKSDGGTGGKDVNSGGGIGENFEGESDGVIGGIGSIGGDFEGGSDGVTVGCGVDSGGGIVGHFEVGSDGDTGSGGGSGGIIRRDFDGESDGGAGSGGGSSDCVPPLPPVHARVGTTTYFSSSFVASAMDAKPPKASPPQLDEGQLPEYPPTHGAGEFGFRSFLEQSPVMRCYRRDMLEPSPSGNAENGAKDSPTMEHPLGGGLRASGSWDGGSASDASPGGGGGFRALPASCDGGGDGASGINPAEGADPDMKSSACGAPHPLSLDCLSPTLCHWEGGPDSLWGNSEEGRSFEDMLADPLLSKMLSASTNSLDSQQAGSVRDFGSFDGSVNLNETSMADCMASLQGNPDLVSGATGAAFHVDAARHDDEGEDEGRTVEHTDLSGTDGIG